MEVQEKELELLQTIHKNSHVRQRDLARIVGVSLGMTNSIIKRLVTKGWLKIKKINNRKIMYAVSAEGIEAIMRRSYRYFKRTIKNVVDYKEAMLKLVEKIKQEGYRGIRLIGKSDLDFIIEHCCHISKISYIKKDGEVQRNIFSLYAENYEPDKKKHVGKKNSEYLRKIFLHDIL